jgi:hypothetical protein
MWRNLLILASLFLTILIFFVLPGIGMLLDIVYFAFFGLAFSGFIITFTIYPVLKKYMIDPYNEQNPEKQEESALVRRDSDSKEPDNKDKDSKEGEDSNSDKWLM